MKRTLLTILTTLFVASTFVKIFAETPLETLKREKQLLPEPIFSLFYAVKNSLEYGFIEGHSEKSYPQKELIHYSRISKELLSEVSKSYDIMTYEIHGDDYLNRPLFTKLRCPIRRMHSDTQSGAAFKFPW